MGGASKSCTGRARAASATAKKQAAASQSSTQYAILSNTEMKAFYAAESYDSAVNSAVKGYISMPKAGSFGKGQNLNHALDPDTALTSAQKKMDAGLSAGMHDLGHDAILYRAAHNDVLAALGVDLSSYQDYTDSKLNGVVKGAILQTKSYSSTSFNTTDNPFITGLQSGGREVYLRIKAGKSTQVIGGNQKQAECILNKGMKLQVNGASFDGTYAFPRAGGMLKRVVLDVEVVP